jgi:predicted transcriptional regulator
MKQQEFKAEIKDVHKIVSFINLPENALKWAFNSKIIIEKEINALGVEDSDGQLAGILGKRDVLLALASMH